MNASEKDAQFDVQSLARLARLALENSEASAFAPQLQQIVGFFDQLRSVDVSGAATHQSTATDTGRLRDDVAWAPSPVEDVLANAPVREDDYFSVPRIVDA